MKTLFDTEFFKNEILFFHNSTKTAGRIEFQNRDEALIAYKNANKLFKFATLIENSSQGIDLFYSLKKKSFDLLIHHTRLVEKGETESIRITGKLLGYPSCCIDAYIKDRLYLTIETGLNWLIRRVESGNGFDPIINPFDSGIRHLPCKITCKKTIDLAKIINKVFHNDILL